MTRGDPSLPYQVQRGRPVLHCWEDRTWDLNGKDVEGSKLNTLTGLKLHKLWAGTIFPLEFELPRLVSLGRAAGPSALKSAFYAAAPYYHLDAGACSILNDLERLVLANWVSSRNAYATQRPTMRPASQTCSEDQEARWKLLLHNSSFKVEMSSPCPSGSSFLSRPLSCPPLSSRRPWVGCYGVRIFLAKGWIQWWKKWNRSAGHPSI